MSPLLPDINHSALSDDQKLPRIVEQVNQWGRLISNEERTKIIKDDAGTPRLLQGFQQAGFSNGNIGIKLSQAGSNVLSATSDDLIYSTDFNLFKIVQSGTTTISASSSAISYQTITHNLGYAPTVIANVNDITFSISGTPITTNGNVPLPAHLQTNVDTVNNRIDTKVMVFAIPDVDEVFFILLNSTTLTVGPYDIKYYLLRETAD